MQLTAEIRKTKSLKICLAKETFRKYLASLLEVALCKQHLKSLLYRQENGESFKFFKMFSFWK